MKTRNVIRQFVLPLMAMVAMAACAVPQNDDPAEGGKMIEELMKDEKGLESVFSAHLADFRELALSRPHDAVAASFEEKAKGKWNSQIAPDMIEQQLTDFFTAAMVLSGPQDAQGALMALYNPWWDTLMLLRLRAQRGNTLPAVRISDFYLLSGETFRGEDETAPTAEARILTVVPEKDPLSVEIWRVVSGTRKRFIEVFPLEGKVSWGKMTTTLMNLDMKGELNRIQTRSAVRMKLTLAFLKNARDVGIAAHLTRLVRTGSEFQLMTYFREPNARPLTRLFAQMPEMFRRDFTPYGYVPTETATLYVLVNTKVPRLYVTVSLMKEVTAKTSSMEWYDLLQTDELLSAWNGRKEVK